MSLFDVKKNKAQQSGIPTFCRYSRTEWGKHINHNYYAHTTSRVPHYQLDVTDIQTHTDLSVRGGPLVLSVT